MKAKNKIAGILGAVAGVAVLGLISSCGGDGNGEVDSKCQLVCDKSAECGGAPPDCMEMCRQDPPSNECLECYKEESCRDVGLCSREKCEEENQQGNVSEEDCARICEKMIACGEEITTDDCKGFCLTMTMATECLNCPANQDCMDFWSCFQENSCWNP